MKGKNRVLARMCSLALVVMLLLGSSMTVLAAAGTLTETEPNDVYTSAKRTYDDYDNKGTMGTTTDVDWWVVKFDYSGTANFYLANIPSNCDYDLRVYSSNGTTVLGSSVKTGNQSELITISVTANTNYYVKINAYIGSSSAQYLLRAKVYPSKTISGVPLYVQAATNTCGCASGRMVLKSYGITVTEATFKAKATALAGSDDFTFVYVVKNTINHYLSDNNNSTRYQYVNVSSFSDADYSKLVLTNILNSHPVQPVIKINNTTYFPYTSAGHYVVIKGMTYSTSSSSYTSVVNDPHYDYSSTYDVPISNMLSYSKAHSGGGYIICVENP